MLESSYLTLLRCFVALVELALAGILVRSSEKCEYITCCEHISNKPFIMAQKQLWLTGIIIYEGI